MLLLKLIYWEIKVGLLSLIAIGATNRQSSRLTLGLADTETANPYFAGLSQFFPLSTDLSALAVALTV